MSTTSQADGGGSAVPSRAGGSAPPSRIPSVVASVAEPATNNQTYNDDTVHGIKYAEEAASIVNRLLEDREKMKRIALGDKYDGLKLDDKLLAEAAEDFRQAKLYQQYKLQEGMRSVELEERIKLLSAEEKILLEERHRLGQAAETMMRRARKKFTRESQAARWLEQQKFEKDKKFIVDTERDRLVRNRREFEVRSGNYGDVYSAPQRESDVVLVMTVALGNGNEEVLTIREHDDFQDVATAFASAHGLPYSVVDPLVDEIVKNARKSTTPIPLAGELPPRVSYRVCIFIIVNI